MMRRCLASAVCVLVLAGGPTAEAGDPGSKGNKTSTTKTQTWHKGEKVIPGQRGSDGRTTGTTGKNIPPGLPGVGATGCPVSPSSDLGLLLKGFVDCLVPPAEAKPATLEPLPDPYNKLSPAAQNAARSPECAPLLKTDWREFEKCLLLTMEEKPARLPDLQSGILEAWGRSNVSYNCYAFAVDRRNPTYWVGPRAKGFPKRAGDIPIASPDDLFDFYSGRGWKEIPLTDTPPSPGEERVVLYARPGGYYEHAAVWTSTAVFAKMGELGVFRFDSIDQMIGPAFGQPAKMFSRSVAGEAPKKAPAKTKK